MLHHLQNCSIDDNFPDNGNWQDEAYNRGVRAGADEVVEQYEKQCLDDTTEECTDVGETAAQGTYQAFDILCSRSLHKYYYSPLLSYSTTEIAFEFCPFAAGASFARPNYKEQCRVVAVGKTIQVGYGVDARLIF